MARVSCSRIRPGRAGSRSAGTRRRRRRPRRVAAQGGGVDFQGVEGQDAGGAGEQPARAGTATTVTTLPWELIRTSPLPEGRLSCQDCCSASIGSGAGHPCRATSRSRDEVGDEPRLPVGPHAGAGGQRVGLGQGVQQLQQDGVAAERLDDPRDGGVVLDVTARGGVRQQQVVPDGGGQQRTSLGHSPSRSPIWVASAAPTSEWSASRPLPMSCSNAPSSNRSGRDTVVDSRAAWTVACTRCRSTVQVCGEIPRRQVPNGAPLREQPAPQAGPVVASMTSISPGPAPSNESRSSRASRGHGLRSSGEESASRVRSRARWGLPGAAAAPATRSSSAGSRLGTASRASATSLPCRTTPSSNGLPPGRRPNARFPSGRGSPGRAQGDVHGVDDSPPGRRQRAREPEPVPHGQCGGDLVALLGVQHVRGFALAPPQFGPHVQQQLPGLLDVPAGPVDDLGHGQRVHQRSPAARHGRA